MSRRSTPVNTPSANSGLPAKNELEPHKKGSFRPSEHCLILSTISYSLSSNRVCNRLKLRCLDNPLNSVGLSQKQFNFPSSDFSLLPRRQQYFYTKNFSKKSTVRTYIIQESSLVFPDNSFKATKDNIPNTIPSAIL
jgi:hypothetical protein